MGAAKSDGSDGADLLVVASCCRPTLAVCHIEISPSSKPLSARLMESIGLSIARRGVY
jgi:hypothetical protein